MIIVHGINQIRSVFKLNRSQHTFVQILVSIRVLVMIILITPATLVKQINVKDLQPIMQRVVR